jgi:hypothetical protein
MFSSKYLVPSGIRRSNRVIEGSKHYPAEETIGPARIQLIHAQHRSQDSWRQWVRYLVFAIIALFLVYVMLRVYVL